MWIMVFVKNTSSASFFLAQIIQCVACLFLKPYLQQFSKQKTKYRKMIEPELLNLQWRKSKGYHMI